MGIQLSAQHDQDIQRLADKIADYLARHNNAADTVDGVNRFWLEGGANEAPARKIEQALELLIGRGVVNATLLADGKILYSLNKKRAERGNSEQPNGSDAERDRSP